MIAFTAANDGAGLLNRKKARQLFFYQKGSLVQSRLYTSGTGGSYGGVRESEVDEYWENA